MSQFFLVSGPDEDTVRQVYGRAVRLFADLARVDPKESIEARGIGLATFDSEARPGSVQTYRHERSVCIACGTWFFRGEVRGDLTALARAAAEDPAQVQQLAANCDGFFALVAATPKSVSVVTDPLGRLHVYQATFNGCTLVSTSSLVLAALTGASLDTHAVREFLALGYILGEKSMFSQICKLPAATVWHHAARQTQSDRSAIYWRLHDWVYERGGDRTADSVEEMAGATREIVGNIFAAYPKPALDLTGGFDSRALLGAALREVPSARIATVVSGPPSSGDVVSASGIADHFGLELTRMDAQPADGMLWWELAQRALALVDGEYDVLEYANILNIHTTLAQHFDASVNGSGGEAFRGYWWELLLPFLGWHGHFDATRLAATRFATDPWAEDLLDTGFELPLVSHIARMLNLADRAMIDCLNTARMDNIYLSVRMHRWQGRIASATSRIWPSFSPFLMKRPMQLAVGSPIVQRAANRMARKLIAHLDPGLADLPMDSGVPAAPITWKTAYRHRRSIQHWRKRLWKKVHRTAGGRTQPPPAVDLTAKLFDLPDFRDLWSAPVSAELYRTGRLSAIVDKGPNAGGIGRAHLGRLVTLELLARALKDSAWI